MCVAGLRHCYDNLQRENEFPFPTPPICRSRNGTEVGGNRPALLGALDILFGRCSRENVVHRGVCDAQRRERALLNLIFGFNTKVPQKEYHLSIWSSRNFASFSAYETIARRGGLFLFNAH